MPEEDIICPGCEGKKITGQLAHREDGKKILGIPVVNMFDHSCGLCNGKGYLPPGHPYREAVKEVHREAIKKIKE